MSYISLLYLINLVKNFKELGLTTTYLYTKNNDLKTLNNETIQKQKEIINVLKNDSNNNVKLDVIIDRMRREEL